MKTIINLRARKSTFLFLGFIVVLFFSSQTTKAQSIQVKGVVQAEAGADVEPLQGVNIYLKDKSVFTTSDRNGQFSFPKLLKIGDVIVFSYLGYVKQQVKITKESANLTITLKEDDNELLGAPNTKKRFSSKKKH